MDFRSAIEILAVLLDNWMTLDERFHLAKISLCSSVYRDNNAGLAE